MVENVNTCVHAVDQAELSPGDTVAVVGGGPIGLTLVQVARIAGASLVLLSEPNELRRELGRELGADTVVDPTDEDPGEIVRQMTGDLGADIVFEAVGLPQTVEQSLHLVRRGGTVVLVGVCTPEATATFSPFDLFWREITLRGALGPGLSFERAVRLLPKLSVEKLLTHEFDLNHIHQAISHRRTGQGIKSFVRL